MNQYQKLSTKRRMVDREKRYKALNELKSIKPIHKDSQSFQGKSCMRKQAPLSCKLWDHEYEQQSLFDFKEIARDPKKKLLASFESSKFAPYRVTTLEELN